MNSTIITKTEQNGSTYFETVSRGVAYCAFFEKNVGEWFVSSHRLALGRGHIGGGKYFKQIADCKPFAALPVLLDLGAI